MLDLIIVSCQDSLASNWWDLDWLQLVKILALHSVVIVEPYLLDDLFLFLDFWFDIHWNVGALLQSWLDELFARNVLNIIIQCDVVDVVLGV